ncbi:MAG: RluA family pseudouridine synthase [Tepidisphaeraceae bacterium]
MSRERLHILFDDADVVAIEKPAGLPTIPAAGQHGSVLRWLGEQLGLPSKGQADPRVRPVHRLDQDTSGVLLFVKNRPAQQAISNQFQNNLTQKRYLAIVAGVPSSESGEVDARLERKPNDPHRMRVHRNGKPAVTHWKVLQRFRDFSLLEVFPKTGKTHQIRVHLAHIGHPLAVDPLYGNKPKVVLRDDDEPQKPRPIGLYLSSIKRNYRETGEPERPLIGRLTLHAESLALCHPNGSDLRLQCDPPKDFRAAINQLTKFGR